LEQAYEEAGRSPNRLARKFRKAAKSIYEMLRLYEIGRIASDIPIPELLADLERLGDPDKVADHHRTSRRAVRKILKAQGVLDDPAKKKRDA
jgi:hypothetical protein